MQPAGQFAAADANSGRIYASLNKFEHVRQKPPQFRLARHMPRWQATRPTF
jgi:hypothetical protein